MLKSISIVATLAASPALAGPDAGPPEPRVAPSPPIVEVAQEPALFDGFYVGVSAKYAFALGEMNYAIGERDAETWEFDPSGAGYGVFLGYGKILNSGFYVGVEGNYQQFGTTDSMLVHYGCRRFTGTLESIANIRGRFGYQTGRTLLYVHGGYSWGQVSARLNNVGRNDGVDISATVSGFAYGVGAEYALGDSVKIGLEYTVNDLADLEFEAFGRDNSASFANSEVVLRLSYTF